MIQLILFFIIFFKKHLFTSFNCSFQLDNHKSI
uniref:Uncharacterized protein n=1 Tax=Rhizophora mucronata TaxID=61149 RepID=A0A2P2PX07_RHIMU